MPAEDIVAWGIDLGTTNSTLCRAVLRVGSGLPDEPEVVELRQPTPAGEFVGTLLPSIVALRGDREFVGQGAKDCRVLMANPDNRISRNVNLFYECKNEIGTSRSYPNAPQGYRSPTEIAGRILTFMRREGIGAESPKHVVVTVPASFQAAQRSETVSACRMAGLDVSGGRLLDEPVAAFIDYAFRYSPELLTSLKAGERRLLLVFDFGGGTCDIALFELSRAKTDSPIGVARRAVSRFHRLGGGDIDLAILHRVLIPCLCKENNLPPENLSFKDKTRIVTPALIAVAEGLKIQLSNELRRLRQFGRLERVPRGEIVARYPSQVTMRIGERSLRLGGATLTAEQFDEALSPFLSTENLFARNTEYRLENSIFAPIADALERGNVEADEIAYVLAVGGSSLLQPVTDALRGYFRHARLMEYDEQHDAQLAVARGASLNALSLARVGKGIVEPVAQDDIFLATQRGDLRIVARGAPLPFPRTGMEVVDSLTVPDDAFDAPLKLSVELVAGPERRLLFRDHWELTMVSRGAPLRLEYGYDENQVFSLTLKLANFPESVPFAVHVENPLSHVANPNRTQEEIDQLEESYRQNPGQAEDLIPKIAERCAELRQHEKAIGLLRDLLRKLNRPVDWLLNRVAMYEEARGNHEAAQRGYEEAARVARNWGGPLFNLALMHERQRDYEAALNAIERAILVDNAPPYRTLRLRIRKQLGLESPEEQQAQALLHAYGAPESLDDWALGWFISAATLAGDDQAQAAGREIRRGRTQQIDTAEGVLPDMRGGR